jgi:UDP-2-acetamido-2-deoxy-ribo-hexuluronate aminotransferase
VEVIALLGAKPVFVDIEPDTYNIDIHQLEAAITPNTKAIIPVSLFGQMPDFERINAIAAKHGIPVIEDGAQSFGATQNGRRSCGVTQVGSTSFYPAKPLGCYGDGGALFTNDDLLAGKMRAIRTHGGEQKYHHIYVGINGRCDTIQAAILQVKLKYFGEELKAREAIAARYDALLKEVCVTPKVQPGNTHTYAQYTIRIADRDGLAAALQKVGIPTCIFYPQCAHFQPAFSHLGYCKGAFPVAEECTHEVISLPMHPWLTKEEQETICREVIQFARESVRA